MRDEPTDAENLDVANAEVAQASPNLNKHPARVQLLLRGARLTSGQRDSAYGDPKINLACAGELKRVFLRYASRSGRPIGPAEHEALDQVLTKIARVATGSVVIDDNYIDGATYFAIAGECAMHSARHEGPAEA